MYANIPIRDTSGARPTRGELLRRYRRLAGLTQEELAARSWYSADYISKLERGQRRLTAAALDRLARSLDLGATELAEFRVACDHPDDAAPDSRPLAGRERELAEIRRLLAGLGAPVLLLAGEPGIGKTRLLDEAAALAEKGGWRVVRGGCQRRSLDPYAPLTNALANSLGQLSPLDRDAALRHAAFLGRLLPEFTVEDNGPLVEDGWDDVGPPRSPAHERRLLVRAVADYLRVVAGEPGTLLILDDLQWAGSDALDLLATLVVTGGTPPLRIVGAYRDSETPVGAPLSDVIADLARASLVRVLPLDPLSEAEAHWLAAQLIPEWDEPRHVLVPAIVQRSSGVPFFLVSFVEDLLGCDPVPPRLEVPWNVTQVLRQRVLALPEPARELLEVAAVVGRVVAPGLLAAVTGQPEADVIEALEAAATARLLDDDGEGGYRFTHDLIRDTIEGDLSAARRRLLHRRVAEALEHLPDWERALKMAELARHFQQGGDPQRALPWALRAGDRAAGMFAHATAAAHYRDAADLAAEIGDERAEVEALDKLGHVLYRAGRFRAAVAPLERAAEIYARLGERARSIKMVARSGEAYGFGGRAAEGLDRLLPVVRALEATNAAEPPSASVADLSVALCTLYLHSGRVQDALETAESAIALAESAGNRPALCLGRVCHGLALGHAGRMAEGRRAFAHAAAIAERLDDPWLLALTVYHQGIAKLAVDDFDRGEWYVRRALDIAERAELVAWATFARAKLSDLLVARGRWAEASVEAARAEAESRYLGPRPGGFYPLHALGRVLLLQGERDEGLQHLHEALAMATRYEHLSGIVLARETLAWQAMRDGRPAEALARLEPVVARREATGSARASTVYAWALLETGNVARAAEVIHAAREKVAESRSRARLPDVLLQSARLAVREHRWESAVDALEHGVAIAQEIGLPYDEALLLHEYGRMHLAKGEPEQASERLAQSLVIFRRLGAAADIAYVEQSVADLPHVGRASCP